MRSQIAIADAFYVHRSRNGLASTTLYDHGGKKGRKMEKWNDKELGQQPISTA